MPDDPTDVQKAEGYTKAWECVTRHRGVALGATLFHYGVEHDFGGVWCNLLPDGLKRLSYFAVKKAYSGSTAGDNTPPVVSGMTVSPASSAPAGGEFTVRADVRDPDGDPVRHRIFLSGNYASGDKRLVEAEWRSTGNGTFAVKAPQRLRVWKVYVQAEDGRGNAGIETRSVKVVAPPVTGTNVALHKPVRASSHQAEYGDCPCTPEKTVDGRADTRWASAGATRSPSRSTSAARPRCARSNWSGTRPTPGPTRSRCPTTAPTGGPCTPRPPVTVTSTPSTCRRQRATFGCI